MTASELLRSGIEKLKGSGISEPENDARELFEYVSGWKKSYYYAHSSECMDNITIEKFETCLKLRSKRIPIQRITGEREFMGLDFYVEDCLIPRQDTEILVEEVLKYIKNGSKPVRLLDICTGTGCIPISILKFSEGVTALASDISEKALHTAEKNRGRNGLTEKALELIKSDLFENIPDFLSGKFDIITSNPPYIPTEVIETLEPEVKDNDPFLALDGGDDGLDLYRRLIPEAGRFLTDNGRIFLEIGSDQAEEVTGFLEKAGYSDIRVIKDLTGLDRVVSANNNIQEIYHV